MESNDNMVVISSVALIFSCLEPKGNGRGFKIMSATPNLAKLVIFQSRGRGQLSLQVTPMSSKCDKEFGFNHFHDYDDLLDK